ncbi:tetratricopeptide repeat protein [Streptomyces specialis]|uniref:tetratricopeptide repeat protein n=1 Tax=Streptomyces specialis TaxID=498367 RepID=UPI00131D2157|nr:tetratricopeptide repeat protein [Streptomyces specialis]
MGAASACQRRDFAAAHASFERALALYQEHGTPLQQTQVLGNLGHTAAGLGDYQQAERLTGQAMAVYHEINADLLPQIDVLILLARIARETDRPSQADTHLEAARELIAQISHPVAEAILSLEQAASHRTQGRHEEALDLAWRSLTLQRTVGNTAGQALAYDSIGQAMRDLGRLDEALDFHRTAVRMLRDGAQPWHLAQTLAHLADTHNHNLQTDLAHQCRTEALTLLTQFTDPEATALRKHLKSLTERL